MNVLVINAGSSSLKYQLVHVENHAVIAKGICERVGSANAFHKHGIDENEVVIDAQMADPVSYTHLRRTLPTRRSARRWGGYAL